MAICKVKDDNIGQAMQRAQADKVDGLWPLFRAALVPTFFGVPMGLAGLFGWGIHSGALARLRS